MEWLSARCFDPKAARDLAAVGVDRRDARMKTEAGAGDYTDTVGFKVSTGDIDAEEARSLLERGRSLGVGKSDRNRRQSTGYGGRR